MSVVVIGCGYWGQNLVRNFAALGALQAVYEPRPDARALAMKIAPETELLTDYDQALERSAALVIATPAETHYALAKRALQHGRDVFVEKPLALALEQGEELVELARASGRILMVGHVLEYHPGVTRLLQLVKDELGDIYYMYSNRLSLGKVRREENILWSFAPHDIAVILRMADRIPRQVAAVGGTYLQPGVADVTLTTMTFEGDLRAHIHVSWLHPYKEQRLVVIGSKKMASFDDVSKRLEVYDRRVEIGAGEAVPIRGEGTLVPYDATEPLRLECEAFLRAVQDRQQPLTDGPSGLRVLRVLDAAQRSLEQHGAPVGLVDERAIAGSAS